MNLVLHFCSLVPVAVRLCSLCLLALCCLFRGSVVRAVFGRLVKNRMFDTRVSPGPN